ncbi:MAG: phosphotransferase [Proteobacteria bacterium]|nr:phosphotransferase [Pseudomonadota bacterium]
MKRTRYIPETPAELTPQWLTQVLTESGILTDGQHVISTTQEVLGDGEGFLGDLLRLNLTYDHSDAGPASMVAKLPKLANRAVGELLGAYERETLYYLDLAARVPLNAPRLYFGDFDRDKASEKQLQILRAADSMPAWLSSLTANLGRFIAARKKRRYILLLEDIDDARPGDQLRGVSLADADRVLQEIACVHAEFWGTTPVEHFWLMPLDVDTNMRHNMFLKSLPVFEEAFKDEVDDGLDVHLDLIVEQNVNLMAELCRAPPTLLHCDLRLDNVFFREDEVVLFDFQLVRHGPAAYDLAYFLSGALDDDVTQADIDGLLTRYHEKLTTLGVMGYRLPDLLRHYRVALLVVLSSLSTIDQMDMGDGRGMDLIRSWIHRLHARLKTCT